VIVDAELVARGAGESIGVVVIAGASGIAAAAEVAGDIAGSGVVEPPESLEPSKPPESSTLARRAWRRPPA